MRSFSVSHIPLGAAEGPQLRRTALKPTVEPLTTTKHRVTPTVGDPGPAARQRRVVTQLVYALQRLITSASMRTRVTDTCIANHRSRSDVTLLVSAHFGGLRDVVNRTRVARHFHSGPSGRLYLQLPAKCTIRSLGARPISCARRSGDRRSVPEHRFATRIAGPRLRAGPGNSRVLSEA